MPKGTTIDPRIKREVIQKLADGQKAADLVKEYGFTAHAMHNWVYQAKQKRRKQQKKNRLKNKDSVKAVSNESALTLEELVQKFKEDVKQLIIKEMLENMAAFEAAS